MKSLHFLLRDDPTASLLIVLLVGLFVLAFNSYRLGKIRRPTMILCSVTLVLALAILIFTAIR